MAELDIGIGGPTVPGASGIGVIDPSTRVRRREDPEVAAQLLKSGTAVADGSTVKMVRGNELREVPVSDLSVAESHGWALTDDVGAHAAQIRTEEDTLLGNVQGIAEQGAAGLTMGLSSLAMQKAGVDMERVRARAKGAGELGEAAQLAGEVLPVVLSGGSAAGAKAGVSGAIRTAGVIPRAVEGAGLLAEKGVVSLLGTGAKAKAAGVVTRGVLEGAASGVGMEIHESALGDRDLAGERMLAAATTGGLFGGAGAGLLWGAGKGLSEVGRGLDDAAAEILARVTKGQKENVAGQAADLVRTGVSGRPAGPRRKILNRLAEGEEGVDQVFNVAHDMDATIAKSATLMKEETAKFSQLTKDTVAETESARVRAMDDMFEAADDDFVPGAVQQEIEEALGMLDREGYSVLREYEHGAMDISRKDLDSIKQTLEKHWDDAVEGGTASKSHHALMSARREIREVRTKLSKSAPTDRRARATADIARNIEAKIGKRLGGDDFGKAGKAWREVNDADAAVMRMKDELFVQSRGKLRGRNLTGKILSGEATDAEVMLWTKRIGNPKYADQQEIGANFFEQQIRALETRAKHFGDAGSASKVTALKKAHASYLDVAKKQSANADLADAFVASNKHAVSGAIAAMGPSGAAVVGGMLGGAPGAAIGAAVNLAARPGAAMRQLSAVMKAGNDVGLDTSKILKNILDVNLSPGNVVRKSARLGVQAVGSAGRAVKAVGESVSGARGPAARLGARGATQDPKRDQEREARHARAIELSHPDNLNQAIAPRMAPIIQHAPGVAGVMAERLSIAASFLASKMPPRNIDPLTGEMTYVDAATAHSFDRSYEATTDPVSALRRLEDGSFTSEHAEALREVWPAMYEDAQEQVMEGLMAAADEGRKIPYQKRAAIGILLDIPTDITMTTDFLAAMSKIHASGRTAESAGQGKPQAQQGKRTRKTDYESPDSLKTSLGSIGDP